MAEKTVWCIHADKADNADNLFLIGNCIALGWAEVEDLSPHGNCKNLKEHIAKVYRGAKPARIASYGDQLCCFAYDITRGEDIVVYPSKLDRKIHVGQIVGPYRWDTQTDPKFPHRRSVRWDRVYERTDFSQGALFEIEDSQSFYRILHFADEFRAAFDGRTVATKPALDSSIPFVVQRIEQNTRDFILKQLAAEVGGQGLAEFIAHLLNLLGYHTRVLTRASSNGADIHAYKDQVGIEPPLKVQIEGIGSVSESSVSAFTSELGSSEPGLIIALGTFTKEAREITKSQTKLRLIDGDELVHIILQHYDKFDLRYKALVPLKLVYVPQPFGQTEE